MSSYFNIENETDWTIFDDILRHFVWNHLNVLPKKTLYHINSFELRITIEINTRDK
jgi:hypothetical protein